MDKVEQFFDTYTISFLKYNPALLPAFYHQPCLIYDVEGVHVLDSAQAVIDYESPILEALQGKLVNKVEYKISQSKPSPGIPESFQCAVAYDFQSQRGESILDLDFDYVLAAKGSDLCMVYGQCGTIRVNKL